MFNKIFILGSNGFVASKISYELGKNKEVINLAKPQFNLENPNCYEKFNFTDSVIIDCITKYKGDKAEIQNNNYLGLSKFINFLNSTLTSFRYIYLSTQAIHFQNIVLKNNYVDSKLNAENLIQEKINNYLILRLSFPFGIGESNERLISNLIIKILRREEVIIDNISIIITPVEYVAEAMAQWIDIINKDVIDFNNGAIFSLEEILLIIYSRLKLKAKYIINNSNSENLIHSTVVPCDSKKVVTGYLLKLIDHHKNILKEKNTNFER